MYFQNTRGGTVLFRYIYENFAVTAYNEGFKPRIYAS